MLHDYGIKFGFGIKCNQLEIDFQKIKLIIKARDDGLNSV